MQAAAPRRDVHPSEVNARGHFPSVRENDPGLKKIAGLSACF